MYKNVIVPFDGGLETRAALAPAADLAWRCGAKVVIVSTNAVDDHALRLALKSRAIAKSGEDVDFWVDLDHDMDRALLAAATHRADALVCVASRYRKAGLLRRKQVATPLPATLLREGTAPVLVVGPETDISRGLPLTELVVLLDDTDSALDALELAREWALQLRLGVRVVAMVADGSGQHVEELGRLRDGLESLRGVPGATSELLEAADPAAAFVALLDELDDSVAVVPRGAGGPTSGPLGAVATTLVAGSARATLLV